ncbi:MAG: MarC family protein [Chloroflexota bacterium]|jgi:multiple antibiotic resistance protein|nr:MarC family protein [Chloroflexota bacterium]
MGTDFARALVSFFAIIDPIGNVLVFYLLTAQLPRALQVRAATASVVAAFLLLAVFALSGEQVLDFMGISAQSFQVAAGALLVLPAYRMVERGQSLEVADADGVRTDVFQVALVPLAVPLLSGPGALATAVSLSQDMGAGLTIAAAAVVFLLAWALFAWAEAVFRLLGESALRVLTRLVGVLLMAIAVDFILEGARTFLA